MCFSHAKSVTYSTGRELAANIDHVANKSDPSATPLALEGVMNEQMGL